MYVYTNKQKNMLHFLFRLPAIILTVQLELFDLLKTDASKGGRKHFNRGYKCYSIRTDNLTLLRTQKAVISSHIS